MKKTCATCKYVDECKPLCVRWSPKLLQGKEAMKHLDEARKLWPGTKRGLQTEYQNFQKKHADWRDLLEDNGIARCISIMIAEKLYNPGYWPMFSTFVNQRRWEEVSE